MQITIRKMSETKAEKNNHILLQITKKNQVIAIKFWVKKAKIVSAYISIINHLY